METYLLEKELGEARVGEERKNFPDRPSVMQGLGMNKELSTVAGGRKFMRKWYKIRERKEVDRNQSLQNLG